MEVFTPEFRHLLQGRSESTDIEESVSNLSARKVATADGVALSPVSKLPAKFHALVQVGIRRSVELSEASIREMNRMHVISTCVLVRGVFETACVLFDVVRGVAKAVESGDTLAAETLDLTLSTVLLGHGPKVGAFIEPGKYKATNILTIIQRLEKDLNVPFGGFYEGLSEYAHPNYHGMMAVYFDGHDGSTARFTDASEGRTKAAMVLATCACATSLKIVERSAQHQSDLTVRLACLAEKSIYERGVWPADAPYPIPRPPLFLGNSITF